MPAPRSRRQTASPSPARSAAAPPPSRAPAASHCRSVGLLDQHPQRARERRDVVRRAPARQRFGGTVSGIGAGRGADHRQAVRDRLGIGHAIALEARRQHEQIGGGVRARRGARRRPRRARRRGRQARDARCRHRAARLPLRSRVRSPAMVKSPRQIDERRQRLDQHVIALARHHRADREQPHDAVAAAARHRRRDRCPDGDGDAVGRRRRSRRSEACAVDGLVTITRVAAASQRIARCASARRPSARDPVSSASG